VSEFVADLEIPRVDVLVHNAGILASERSETAEGIETTLATHVIGPFLLTSLLIDRLERAREARVIWVSSGGMYGASLNLEDPQWAKRDFDGVRAYAEAKRAQVVLNEILAAKFTSLGISFYAMHPGWADTLGVRHSLPRFWWWMRSRLRTPAQGADSAVWLSVCERVEGMTGLFWFDRRPVPTHLVPWTRDSDDDKRRLLKLCEELAQVAAKEEHVV
jgi:NAD(P)-dependent dehydrogenase (short-subunit alcohol dehydrogenase family)